MLNGWNVFQENSSIYTIISQNMYISKSYLLDDILEIHTILTCIRCDSTVFASSCSRCELFKACIDKPHFLHSV